MCRCFPHIVNLACKAVLSAITDLSKAADDVEEDDPDIHWSDVIATIRSLVNAVCVSINYHIYFELIPPQIRKSNLKKQWFSEYVMKTFKYDYQLLRDVITRWSSTLLMISRVLKLRKVSICWYISCILIVLQAIKDITNDADFQDLEKFFITESDWKLLENYQEILQVHRWFSSRPSN